MTAQDYIASELADCSRYALSEADEQLLKSAGLEEFIYAKLTSKRFRKWAIDEDSEKQVRGAIKFAIDRGQPVQFRYPFGGYKLWRLPTSPEVDWAELFSIAYHAKHIAPVAAAYQPGVEFIFSSDDIIVERMDNVPVADTDAYFNSFKQLLGMFGEHFPDNFRMDIKRVGDLYENKDDFERELAANIENAKQFYADSAHAEQKQKMLKTSELNITWQGAKDLTNFSPAEKQAMIEMGPVYHDAYGGVSKRREFLRGEDKIVVFTTKVSKAIAVGTTRSTITKFWTGFGVLEAAEDDFTPKILSPDQLEAWNTREFDEVQMEFAGLNNFDRLRVYKKS